MATVWPEGKKRPGMGEWELAWLLPARFAFASGLRRPPKPWTVIIHPGGCRGPEFSVVSPVGLGVRGLEGLCGLWSTPGSPGLTCPLGPEKPTPAAPGLPSFRYFGPNVWSGCHGPGHAFLIVPTNHILPDLEVRVLAFLFLVLSSRCLTLVTLFCPLSSHQGPGARAEPQVCQNQPEDRASSHPRALMLGLTLPDSPGNRDGS